MADDEPETFDVSIDDVSPEEFAALLSGLALALHTAVQLERQGVGGGAAAQPELVSALTERMLFEIAVRLDRIAAALEGEEA